VDDGTVNSAAVFAASSNHALAALSASAPAPDGRAPRWGAASDPVLAIDAEALVWKPILEWIVAHR
jgi:hypothetical protein